LGSSASTRAALDEESEEMTTRIVADGGDPIASTPEEYAANIEREEVKWAALIKKLGLKIE
jgi:tripartite-type tricarboxylate transporter receptor subunit TctC